MICKPIPPIDSDNRFRRQLPARLILVQVSLIVLVIAGCNHSPDIDSVPMNTSLGRLESDRGDEYRTMTGTTVNTKKAAAIMSDLFPDTLVLVSDLSEWDDQRVDKKVVVKGIVTLVAPGNEAPGDRQSVQGGYYVLTDYTVKFEK